MWPFTKKKDKKLSLFVLTKKDNPDRFLSIGLSKNEMIEYAHTLLRFEHEPHFKSWCTLRGYDADQKASWDEYFKTCIDQYRKSEYFITNVLYRLEDVVAIMRMFGGCSPIGCTFETDTEYDHAKSKKQLLECQIEFEKFWRQHHQEEIMEIQNADK